MDTQELQRIKNKFDIIGNDAALNRAIETAVAVAPTDLTVLISGESGVGKENIPRIIHQSSLRKTGKYLAVNCGGLPEGTINSELFGHEKGAFTGAVETRKGYFEEANGGTLFLDEVGDLPASTQAMLLRVLQNGEYMKVGSSKVQKTDVRVVAATNVNLLYAVSQGKFREDLYYRLNAIQIKMPSLRERKDDIYLLFRKFASDFSEKYNVSKVNLSHDAILMLQNYRWPGNIRQLKNIAESISAMESRPLSAFSGRTEIDAATLGRYLPKEDPNAIPVLAGGSAYPRAFDFRRFREIAPAEWRITVETSLAVPADNVLGAVDAVDVFIVDCKDMDPGIYHRYTGGDSSLMTENLQLLLQKAGPDRILVRVPLIPRFNTEEDQACSAELLRKMGVKRLDLFSYVVPD